MKNLPQPRPRPLVGSFGKALLAGLLVLVLATTSAADGRAYNPSRMRPKAETGRQMRRTTVPEPVARPPTRLKATIPDPTPRKRGGEGLMRRGRYFYEVAKPIQLSPIRAQRLLPPDPALRASQRGR